MARLNMNKLYKVTREELREASNNMKAMRYATIEYTVCNNSQGDITIISESLWREYDNYEYDFTKSIEVNNKKAKSLMEAQVYRIELLHAEEDSDLYYIVKAYSHHNEVIFDNTELYRDKEKELWNIHVEAIKTDDDRRREREIDECADSLEEICSYVECGAVVHIDNILNVFSNEYDSVYIDIDKKCYKLTVSINSKLNNKCLCDITFNTVDDEYELYEGHDVTCYAYKYDDKYSCKNIY